MNPLLDEYFKRDLTSSEEEQLASLLSSSPEETQRFASLMEAHYRTLGVPEPEWTENHLPSFFPKPWTKKIWVWALPVLLLSGCGYFLHRWFMPMKVLETQPPVSSTPANQGPTLKKAKHGHLTHAPQRNTREELSVDVENPHSGLVTVKVKNPQGQEIRVLFAGILPAGQKTFTWDGMGENGSVAAPGTYILEVISGAKTLSKEIHLGISH